MKHDLQYDQVAPGITFSFLPQTRAFVAALRATMERGACVGLPMDEHDATSGVLALRALSNCARCSVVSECRAVVMPKASFYSGVCAGNVYVNGRVSA